MNNITTVMTDEEPSKHNTSYIESIAEFTLDYEQRDNCTMSIVCCSPSQIQEYNRTYRGKDYVPDVLSFVSDEVIDTQDNTHLQTCIDHNALIEKDHTENNIGDILICFEQIKQQAEESLVKFEEEVARIIIHGVLHLLGYTHESYESTEPMLVRQEEILRELMIKR